MTLSTNYGWLILSLLLSSCYKTNKTEPLVWGFVFVSETFQNRFVDDGLDQIHNADNVGFFTSHFPIEETASPSTLNALQHASGILWRKAAFIGEVIDLTRYDPEPTNKVIYVYEKVHVARDSTLFLCFGSDDGIRIWHNGELKFSLLKQRGLRFNENTIKVALEKGDNTFVYKVEQGDGGWALQRTFVSKEQLQTQIDEEVPRLYQDVLPSHWVGVVDSLSIRLHQKTQYDSKHEVTWRWLTGGKTIATVEKLETNHGQCKIKLPSFWDRTSILWGKLTVENAWGIVFHEWYPVLDSSFVTSVIHKIGNAHLGKTDGLKGSDIATVFERDLFPNRNNGWNYSTRYKSWIIAQELGLPNAVHGPLVGSYVSPSDSSRQLFRWFSSEAGSCDQKLLFVLHGEYKQETSLWGSYEGVSHSLLAKRNALATSNNILAAMPHGRGTVNFADIAKEEIGILRTMLGTETSEIILMSWSRASFPLLEFARDPTLHISTLILISPVVHQSELEVWETISKIHAAYPHMKWIVFHGLQDAEVPIIKTRHFVEMLKERFHSVYYEEVPYASHWNYPIDVEQKALEWAF